MTVVCARESREWRTFFLFLFFGERFMLQSNEWYWCKEAVWSKEHVIIICVWFTSYVNTQGKSHGSNIDKLFYYSYSNSSSYYYYKNYCHYYIYYNYYCYYYYCYHTKGKKGRCLTIWGDEMSGKPHTAQNCQQYIRVWQYKTLENNM